MAATSATTVMAAVAGEFLEAAIPTILYIRGVYPAELFDRKRSIPRKNMARRGHQGHDGMDGKRNCRKSGSLHRRGYQWQTVGEVRTCPDLWKLQSALSSSLSLHSRFVFEFDLATDRATLARSLAPQARESLEDAFRQVLLKINVADSLLSPLPKELTFSLYAHTASRLHDNENWEEMATEGNEMGRADRGHENILTVPLKSVQAGCFRLQLLVQSPRGS
eukprot:768772-Hanusia_phi.AAC.1